MKTLFLIVVLLFCVEFTMSKPDLVYLSKYEIHAFTPVDIEQRFQKVTDRAKDAIKSSSSIVQYDNKFGFIDGDLFITVDDIATIYELNCLQMNLDPNFLIAQAYHESSFNPNAKSPANATGWSQFIKSTWVNITGYPPDDRSSILKSIEAQCKYMYILVQIKGSLEHALYSYLGAPHKSYFTSINKTYESYLSNN